MLETGRNPRRLLRRQQIVRRGGLDLDDSADRVLDLVHLVAVPAGDQPLALIEVAPAQCPAAAAKFDYPPGGVAGIAEPIIGRFG